MQATEEKATDQESQELANSHTSTTATDKKTSGSRKLAEVRMVFVTFIWSFPGVC